MVVCVAVVPTKQSCLGEINVAQMNGKGQEGQGVRSVGPGGKEQREQAFPPESASSSLPRPRSPHHAAQITSQTHVLSRS